MTFLPCYACVARVDDVHELFPLARRRALIAAIFLAVGLLVVVRHFADAGTAREVPRPRTTGSLRVEAGPKLVVHVVGAVRHPGLYKLPDRSRIADAVARAGGPKPSADLSAVNLAAPISDGVQVLVPARVDPSAGGTAPTPTSSGTQGPVHLNTATLEQLDSLPGVGPVTAEKILEYRQQHGAFSSIDDLDAIPGIGPARLEQLREVAAP